jgi:hypothetical protein
MVFDITYFGYGAGLVITGWVCGMLASAVFNLFSHIR